MSGAQGLVRTPIYFLTQLLFVACLNNIRPSWAVPPWHSQSPLSPPSFSARVDTTGLPLSSPARSLSFVFYPIHPNTLSHSHHSPHYNFTGRHQPTPHYPHRLSERRVEVCVCVWSQDLLFLYKIWNDWERLANFLPIYGCLYLMNFKDTYFKFKNQTFEQFLVKYFAWYIPHPSKQYV